MMLTYEAVCEDLLLYLEESDLIIYEVQNFIETGTTLREFRAHCGFGESLEQSSLRAEAALIWDARLTAQSIYGGGLSDRNRPILEVELRYSFPSQDFTKAGALARDLQGLIGREVEKQTSLRINYEISVQQDAKVEIQRAYVFYTREFDLSGERLEAQSLAREIARVLKVMSLSGLF